MPKFLSLTFTSGRALIVNEDEVSSVQEAPRGGLGYSATVWTKGGARYEVMESAATIRMYLDHECPEAKP